MKRDMNLIRQILLTIQDTDTAGAIVNLEVTGYDRDKIGYHVALLIDAGYINGEMIGTKGDPYGFIVRRLTWDGHEFIDLAQNESIWKKALDKLSDSGLEVSIAIVKTLLSTLIERALGLSD